tara:strand:- start:79 stop:291 length:213 start_codon:yes stop_codon:yes gene_type:complete
MEYNMNQKPIYIKMVVKLIDDSIRDIHKQIDSIQSIPNYFDNKDYRNDVTHLKGRIVGLEKILEKIDILF